MAVFYTKKNKKKSMPNSSYLMMHALEEGFIIMLYSCRYDTIVWNDCVHRKHAVKLILTKEMVARWHESLYHSRDKSRQTPTGMCEPNLRLFM